MASDPEKLNFRLVLLGSVGTGFLFSKYLDKYRPTVEDLFTKDFDLGTLVLRVDFLDTSGSMQFPAMRRLSINTGSAFLIVYSVDDFTSFEVAKRCIEEIQETRSDYQEIPIIFAGNKCDLPPERRVVHKEDVSNYVFCDLPRLRVKVIECSCKDDVNIKELFKAYLNLARISISTITTDGGLKRRSSAHASGKWRLGGLGSNSSQQTADQSSEKNSSNSSLTQGNNNCSTNSGNNNKTTVMDALIKSVSDATGSTLNRVSRSLGGTNSGGPSSVAGTPTHHNNNQQSLVLHLNHSSQDSNIVINEDTATSNSTPHHQHNNNNNNNNNSNKNNNNNNNNTNHHQLIGTNSQPISAHLSLNQRIKPRSKSLMRRSTRKSKIRDQDDITQCLPS